MLLGGFVLECKAGLLIESSRVEGGVAEIF
jgi:hypothetical protein